MTKRLFPSILLLLGSYSMNAQSVTLAVTQVPCNQDGIVTATTTGMTPPLTVTWNVYGIPQQVHSGVAGSTDQITNYPGSTVYVYVQDANNVTTQGFLQAQPPFAFTVATTPAICPALGTATATVIGGASPYSFVWTDQSNTVVGTTNPVNLPGGSYRVAITDANGCFWGTQFDNDTTGGFVEYISPFTVSVTATNASCTNGSATISPITGGTPPYSYLWSNGSNATSLSGLIQGYYNVTVTDAQGCTGMGYADVQQVPQITVNSTSTPATCIQSDGAITAFASGGVPPYTYLFDNGGTTATQTNLLSGDYQVTATDVNGCVGTAYVYVSSSTPITVTYTSTPSSCTAGTGTATLAISGGQTPYTIDWNTTPAQSGTTATGLMPGLYSFNVTDANGCVRSGQAYVQPIDVISGSLTMTQATCTQSNGAMSISVTGGVAPYTYSWNTGSTASSITNLPAGYYSVSVVDANSCQINKAEAVTIYSPVNVGVSSTPASCIYTADGTINCNVWEGTPPYTYNGQSNNIISNLLTGYQYVYITDANGCTAHDDNVYVGYDFTNNSCYCTITGTVYDDANGNCVQDAGEAGIQNIQMHLDGFGYAYTNAAGVYSFKAPSGSYTLSESVLAFYPLASCQNNAIAVTSSAATNCSQTYNFANTINPIHDIHVSTWNYSWPVPGYAFDMVTLTSNDGTVTEPTIQMGYTNDGQLGAPVYISGGIMSGGPLSYDATPFPTLSPGASQQIHYQYNVPGNIPLSTVLLFKDTVAYMAPMTNWLNDYSPWNNVDYYNTYVVGSFDPNFMEVNPKGVGPDGDITYNDSVLEYMVHFQNVGTYQAQNVAVIDTLDGDLDWSTMRPVFQSHPCVVKISENGVATFSFDNINLPAKQSDPAGSNGMFTFTVHTKHNLPIGTQFINHASIYFDYNAPVVTNTVVNTLASPTQVNNVAIEANGTFSVYPNPAGKAFNAVINSSNVNANALMNISDVTGKVLISKVVALQKGAQTIPVDINRLSSGVYFVTLNNNGASKTCKLVVVK